MNYEKADNLARLTKLVLDNGYDYVATLKGSECTVELIEASTGNVIAEESSEFVEEALESLLVRFNQ